MAKEPDDIMADAEELLGREIAALEDRIATDKINLSRKRRALRVLRGERTRTVAEADSEDGGQ